MLETQHGPAAHEPAFDTKEHETIVLNYERTLLTIATHVIAYNYRILFVEEIWIHYSRAHNSSSDLIGCETFSARRRSSGDNFYLISHQSLSDDTVFSRMQPP
jgi:hypothetical protein